MPMSPEYKKIYRARPEVKAREKELYELNKEAILKQQKERIAKRIKYTQDLKSNTPCMDCKQSYPYYVMDFDHRDPTQKVAHIQKMCTSASWERLLQEIDKCDIVCANCHRIRTFNQGLWRK